MSEKRKYRTFTPDQKAEIVLAGLRGDRTVRDICREYEIAETLYYQWRERLPGCGESPLAAPRGKGDEGLWIVDGAVKHIRRNAGTVFSATLVAVVLTTVVAPYLLQWAIPRARAESGSSTTTAVA